MTNLQQALRSTQVPKEKPGLGAGQQMNNEQQPKRTPEDVHHAHDFDGEPVGPEAFDATEVYAGLIECASGATTLKATLPTLAEVSVQENIVARALHVESATAVDFVTVLRTCGPKAAKTWISSTEIKDYDDILWVRVEEERPVNNILELSRLLQEIESDPTLFIIRGRLRPDWQQILDANLPAWSEKRKKDGKDVLVQPGPGWTLRRKELFADVAHHWALFDSDEFRTKADPVTQMDDAAFEYLDLLPSEFDGVSFHMQLSNSAGLPKNAGQFKVHNWFWFDKPYTNAQLKAWAEALWPVKSERIKRVDTSVFDSIQIHYTSAPVMAKGVVCPVKRRSAFKDGSALAGDAVVLRMPESAQAAQAVEATASDLVDPRTKSGLVGAYCRAFDLEQITAEHIPGVFDWVTNTRLTWLGGGGAPEGAFVRDDRQGVGASHNTWPFGTNRTANKWDLVRHFKFGGHDVAGDDFEQAVLRNMDPQHRPSHAAMCEWVKSLPEVQRELPDGDPDKIVTARSVIDRLRTMSKDEVLENWAKMTVPLARGAAEDVIDEVQRLCGVKVRALKAELTDARESVKREHKRAAVKARTGDRKVIEYRPEDKSEIAAMLEQAVMAQARPGEYVSFGGLLAHVTTKRLPYTHLVDDTGGEAPMVAQIEPMDDVAVLSMAERAAAFCETRDGVPQLIGVPTGLIDILLKKKAHAAPQVTGLVTHPIVLRDGEVLAGDGLHARSGLFLQGASCPGTRAYTQDEAVEAMSRLRTLVLDGFEFASDIDADAAIAGMITGVQRRLVDMAPGLAVLAGAQSSGKTTLARRLHVILTGQDMPVSAFPQGDEAEMQKRLLSMLLRSPAMVCFDNIGDGTTFRSGALAAAMTGPVISQRVLGMSRDADCLTNVLFVITGNNLSLGADEATRWIVARLAPKNARPEERAFNNPDVVGHAMSIRQSVLRDVVGIVAGHLVSGQKMQTQTRFAQWDRMVRQPMLWAGAGDLAQCFKANTANSEDLLAHQGLLQILWEVFGETEFKARDVAAVVSRDWDSFDERPHLGLLMMKDRNRQQAADLAAELESVLANLRAKDAHNERSVGRVLKAKEGRVAQVRVGDAEVEMTLVSSPSRGVLIYRVERRA